MTEARGSGIRSAWMGLLLLVTVLGAALLWLGGPWREVTDARELVGNWRFASSPRHRERLASYGVPTLTLYADGRFCQRFPRVRGKPLLNRGRWELRSGFLWLDGFASPVYRDQLVEPLVGDYGFSVDRNPFTPVVLEYADSGFYYVKE